MKYSFSKKIIQPCLYSRNNIITGVNKEFIELTGFKEDELLGKSQMIVGAMIRINTQILLHNISSEYSGYIFTKSLSAREVNISLFYDKDKNKEMYTFVEKSNSRLDDKLIFEKQTMIDNIEGVAIYSVPDLILLKANQKYLDFHDYPYNEEETSIGLHISEIVTGYTGTESEVITNTVIESRKSSYLKEIKFEKFARDTTYWDSTRTPVFEDEVMKYMLLAMSDVTERVLENQSKSQQNMIIERQKKQLEKQKEELEQKNAQLISIMENLSEGVMVTDNRGRYIMVNTEAKSLIYQPNVVIDSGDTYKSTTYFDMKGNELSFKDLPGIRALRGEKVKNVKLFVKNPTKEYFMEFSSIPIKDTNGDLTMVVSCFHDITETVKQSRKIEEQKKELEAIIENIADGISIFNNKGQYILSNKSSREMFTKSCEDMGKVGDVYKQSEHYNINGERINFENVPASRVMRGEKFKDMRMSIEHSNKTMQLDVSGTPIYDSEGKFVLGVLCTRDMTDYVNNEEIVRGRYEFMNRMIDTFDLPVVRLSCPDLKVVGINKKAFSIAKLIRPDIISIRQLTQERIEDLFKPFEPFDINKYHQYINEIIKDKKTKYLNKKSYLINGNQVYWNVILEPISYVNGEIQEILIVVIDVTDEVKSNIVMEKTLKSQGEFLANISHELKTPLNVIFSAVQLFSLYCNNGSLDDKKNSIIKYIDSIKLNSYRLSKLINNIVDSSKIEAGFFEINLSNNNIVGVVEEIVMSVTDFIDSKGLNIIFDTDIEEKIIACDPEKIERIILNLISNAIKFSNAGDEIFVEVKDKNEYIEISVSDTGVGIKKKNLDMIFDRFKQVDKSLSRNAEGSGIGLSLVKSIVELHDGSISVQSEFGKGSKFIVKLPVKKVMQENNLSINNIRNISESIQVEFSDVRV